MSIEGSGRPTAPRTFERLVLALGPRDSGTVDRFHDDDSAPTVVMQC